MPGRSIWKTSLAFIAVLALAAPAAASAKPAPAMERLSQQGRWLVDPQGRVVLLHGGNMIALVGDANHMVSGGERSRWSPATPRRFRDAGFNAIRLVIFTSRLAPEQGQIDSKYLDAVAETVAAYAREGVHVLVDLHQDEYSALVGVRGMPAWMTLTDGLKRDPRLSFPNGYFKDPAVQRAFDNFWANKPLPDGRGVQQAYMEILAAVARRFAGDPAVFGIDLMNEPATGTPCSEPDPRKADCPELERTLLAPFYERAGEAMRTAAPHTILFVEPFMLQGALGVPIQTPMPGLKQQGLSFHNYGAVRDFREKVSESALARANAAPAAILNTEWGSSNDAADLAAQGQDFDNRLIPWLAWARGPFEALVDPAASAKPPVDAVPVLRAFARPYPQATAGTPLSLRFDADSGRLDYRWSSTGPDGLDRHRLVTEIRMPAPSYPQGYRASASGGRIVSKPGAGVLRVVADRPAGEVSVHAVRLGKLPPLAAPKGPASTGYSLDSMLGDLLKDERAKAIILHYLPTLASSDQLGLAPQIRLRAMQPYLPEMTEAMAAQMDKELRALPPR